MTLDLSLDEADALAAGLARHLVALQDEVAHTDSRSLQLSLHADMDRLEAILRRLNDLRGGATPSVPTRHTLPDGTFTGSSFARR